MRTINGGGGRGFTMFALYLNITVHIVVLTFITVTMRGQKNVARRETVQPRHDQNAASPVAPRSLVGPYVLAIVALIMAFPALIMSAYLLHQYEIGALGQTVVNVTNTTNTTVAGVPVLYTNLWSDGLFEDPSPGQLYPPIQCNYTLLGANGSEGFVVMNIPQMVINTTAMKILDLFFVANYSTITAFVPLPVSPPVEVVGLGMTPWSNGTSDGNAAVSLVQLGPGQGFIISYGMDTPFTPFPNEDDLLTLSPITVTFYAQILA